MPSPSAYALAASWISPSTPGDAWPCELNKIIVIASSSLSLPVAVIIVTIIIIVIIIVIAIIIVIIVVLARALGAAVKQRANPVRLMATWTKSE